MGKNNNVNAQTGAESSKFYDHFWNSYEQQFGNKLGKYGKARLNFIIEVLSFSKVDTHLKILDLGCGTGWLSNVLANFGDVVGVDFSPKTLEKASLNYGNQVRFHLGNPNYGHLGLGEDTKFDVVVSSEVIEHVHDHQAFIHQINQFLVDDGICIITTPNGNAWNAYQKDERFKTFQQPIEDWLTPTTLRQLITSGGFSVQIHTGWTSSYYDYNLISKYLGKPKVIKLCEVLRIKNLWGQVVLPYSIYQFLSAQKVNIELQ